MLQFLDFLLTLVHFAIVGFNLLGWIWPRTRKAHLVLVCVTAASWFILGIWFGWGYCPVTDWQWRVKEQLGETNLPGSFIKYYADKISGRDVDSGLVTIVTVASLVFAAVMTVYVNFFRKKK